jgi:Yip1 domain
MMPNEPSVDPAANAIQPLKDVWLRPRRVFRELAERPMTFTDYALPAVLSTGNLFVFQSAQATPGSVGHVLANSLLFGPIFGIASTYLFAGIYQRLVTRAGGNCSRAAVFHVLAYGALPVVAALGIWGLATLLIGDAALPATPAKELDGFQAVIARLELLTYAFLWLWSVVLQVMGFSELQGIAPGKAMRFWILGQALCVLALFMLLMIIGILFPNLLPVPAA